MLDKSVGPAGPSSLADLSDVKITDPTTGQTLVYYSLPFPRFSNERYHFGYLDGITRNVVETGVTLLEFGDGAVFDYYQCAESITFGDSVTQAFEQVISALKVSAKSSGKAGAKLSVPSAAIIVGSYDNIADEKSVFRFVMLEVMFFIQRVELQPQK